MCFIVSGQKKNFKCLLQTEYCMAAIKQMTGEVDVTAPGSSRRPPVSLEYQRLSGWHFPHKTIAELQKNRISRSCKVYVPAKHEIDWSSNLIKKRKQHEHESSYRCAQCMVTLCIDPYFRFYHQHKDYITKCKSWKRQNSNNWLCSNMHACRKLTVSYNFIYIQLTDIGFQKYLKVALKAFYTFR